MEHRLRTVDSGDGWRLELRRFRQPGYFDPNLRPLLIIPGYCMNDFALRSHPSGKAMVDVLTEHGREVWTAHLRGQGASERLRGAGVVSLANLSLIDLPKIMEAVRSGTSTQHQTLHGIGCSLGATVFYGYLAHRLNEHGLASMTSIGGPLRWGRLHPLLKTAFLSPRLAGMVPVRGTRGLATRVLPAARLFPRAVQLYMNAHQVNLSEPHRVTLSVDDPSPRLNRQIGRWINAKDLVVHGINVCERLQQLDLPVLAMYANRDGIAPPDSVRSVADIVPRNQVTLMEVGDDQHWFAHADLFISHHTESKVFGPLSSWLRTHG